MSLSQAEIGLVVEELAPIAGRSTLQRVFESRAEPRAVVLRLREPGANRFVQIATTHEATRLHFAAGKPDQPPSPRPFTMLLRKWLEGAALEAVEQVGGDRVVRLDFAAPDPRWQPPEDDPQARPPRRDVALVCELAGRVGNLFLLDGRDRVMGRQTDEAIAGRNFERGDLWEPPPPPPDTDIGARVRWDLDALDASGQKRSRAVARHYDELRERCRRDQLLDGLRSELRERVDKLDRRAEHIEGDLENIDQADEYRRRGELLQSAHGRVDRGDNSVEVPDFYDEAMTTVEIPLDPAKTLQENIEDYFHEASRLEDARERVEQRLLETLESRDRAAEALETLEEELDHDIETLRDWRETWEQSGILPAASDKKSGSGRRRSRDPKTKSRPYREFESTGGHTILVGKGAEENDTLSTKIARGRDIWLHARDWPGAHVVLRVQNKNEFPDRESLLDAATLAAHFSERRGDTVAEVTYTRAKHVRKTKNLPPGRVFVADESVIPVERDERRLERLLKSETGR